MSQHGQQNDSHAAQTPLEHGKAMGDQMAQAKGSGTYLIQASSDMQFLRVGVFVFYLARHRHQCCSTKTAQVLSVLRRFPGPLVI